MSSRTWPASPSPLSNLALRLHKLRYHDAIQSRLSSPPISTNNINYPPTHPPHDLSSMSSSRHHPPSIFTHFKPRPTTTPTIPDLELFLVLTIVSGILVLQLLAILLALRRHNVQSKAKWRRMRADGVVVVRGPAMIWVREAPPRATFSTFNLRLHRAVSRDSVVW